MTSRRTFLATLAGGLAVAAAPSPAAAHGYRLGPLSIGHLWAPPPGPGDDGVPVYGAILNTGDRPARLVAVQTPAADRARFRLLRDGEPTWSDAIAFPPGRPLAMAAWRQHLWLSGLRRPLAAGDSFELTLDFGPLGRQTVSVVVEAGPGH